MDKEKQKQHENGDKPNEEATPTTEESNNLPEGYATIYEQQAMLFQEEPVAIEEVHYAGLSIPEKIDLPWQDHKVYSSLVEKYSHASSTQSDIVENEPSIQSAGASQGGEGLHYIKTELNASHGNTACDASFEEGEFVPAPIAFYGDFISCVIPSNDGFSTIDYTFSSRLDSFREKYQYDAFSYDLFEANDGRQFFHVINDNPAEPVIYISPPDLTPEWESIIIAPDGAMDIIPKSQEPDDVTPPSPASSTAPVIDAAGYVDQSTEILQSGFYDLSSIVTDADGGVLTYSVLLSGGGMLPSFFTIDGSSGHLNANPDHTHTGDYTLDVTVTDDTGKTAQSSFGYTITDAQNNSIVGGAGDDTIMGGDGDDTIDGGDGGNYLYGEDGDDSLIGGINNDFLYGGDGNDTLFAGSGDDALYGDAGNDSLIGSNGNDSLYGGDDDDFLNGGNGFDDLFGGDGDDTFIGGDDNDDIFADSGDDSVSAGSGRDEVYGAAGNDTIDGGKGDDTIYGGDDDDSIDGGTGSGSDLIYGDSGNDTIEGGDDDDTIEGGSGDDSIRGEDDNDYLDGSSGNDTLIGGNGNDTIFGNADGDYLSGGFGDDVFFFNNINQSTATSTDFISDFTQGSDLIELDSLGFTAITSGAASGATLGYAVIAGDTFIYDDANFLIQLDNSYVLTNADFIF